MTIGTGRVGGSSGSNGSDDTRHKASLARFAKGSSANLAGALVFGCTNLFVTLIVTRATEPARAGAFFTATSIFMIALSVAVLGAESGLVYFVSRSRALGRTDRIPRFFQSAIWPVITVGSVLGLTVSLYAPEITSWMNATNIEGAVTFVRATAPFIPLAALETVTLAGTQGLGTMRPTVMVEQIGRSSFQLALVAIVVLTPHPELIGLGWALPYLPAALVAVLWWRKRISISSGGNFPTPEPTQLGADSRSLWARFWRFSGPRALSRLAQQSMQRLDIILVASMATPAAAAVYTAATRFIVLGQTGNRAISVAVQPRLAHSLARGDLELARTYYRVGTAWLMLLTWPLYLTLIVAAPSILQVFGPTYVDGATALCVLAATMLWATSCGMVDMVLIMGGRTSWNLFNALVSLAVNVVLDIYLIPTHSYLGAALGWACAIALRNLLSLIQVKLLLNLHPFCLVTFLSAAIPSVCFAGIPLLFRLSLGNSWSVITTAIALGLISYVTISYLCRGPLNIPDFRGLRPQK